MNENGNDLEQGLNRILSDPAALASIMSIVSGLSKGNADSQDSGASNAVVDVTESSLSPQADMANVTDAQRGTPMPPAPKNDRFANSLGLLCAIKPFLDTDRAKKLDKITQILKVVSLTDLLK